MVLCLEMALTLEVNRKEKEAVVAFKRTLQRAALDCLLQHVEHVTVCLYLLLFFADCPEVFPSAAFLSFLITHPTPAPCDTPRLEPLKAVLRDVAPASLVSLVRISHSPHE